MTRQGLSRDVLSYGLGQMAGRATALLTFPIYTRVFDTAEYGALALAVTIVALLMPVYGLGSDVVYATFFFDRDEVGQAELTVTWFGTLAAWIVVVSAGLGLVAGPLGEVVFDHPEGRRLTLLVIAVAATTFAGMMLGQVLRNRFRAGLFATLNVGAAVVTAIAGLVAVLWFDQGIAGVLVGMLVGELVFLPLRVWFARGLLRGRFSRELVPVLLRVGLPVVPASAAFWVFTYADRAMIAWLATLTDVGYYAVAVTITSPLVLAASAFGDAWLPRVLDAEQRGSATRETARVLVLVLVLGGIAATALVIVAPTVVTVAASPRYAPAAAAVAPLAIGAVALLASRITATGLYVRRRTGITATHAWVAAGVNLALNLALIPPLGFVGAAWATAGAYAYLAYGLHRSSQRVWLVTYDRRTVRLLAVIVLAIVVGAFADDVLRALLVFTMATVAIAGTAWPALRPGAEVVPEAEEVGPCVD